MYVVISKFEIANNLVEEVRTAFVQRPHLVDSEQGFIRMEVMSPVGNQREIWLTTHWTDQASYQNWHRSSHYHHSHHAIPKGLKLVSKSTEIKQFEVFAT